MTNKQCGGARGLYNGPQGACCESEAKCVRLNKYYSRCLKPADIASQKLKPFATA